jgi:hypothetical protein
MIDHRLDKFEKEDEYFDKLVESINVFTLLRDGLLRSLKYIQNTNDKIRGLAFRTMYIDINSFIDELAIFEGIIYNVERENYKFANNFLLLTHELRKFLKRYKKQIKLFRNSVYAHNYRDKKNKYTDPLELLMIYHQDTPIFYTEIQSLGEMCVLIVAIIKEQFSNNERVSYFYMQRINQEFKLQVGKIEAKSSIVPDGFLEKFQKDVFEKKDFLKGNEENYLILSKKLKCKILQ